MAYIDPATKQTFPSYEWMKANINNLPDVKAAHPELVSPAPASVVAEPVAPAPAPAPSPEPAPVVDNNIPVGNVDVSIEDYLRSVGKAWDYSSRSVLAIQNGIINYTGTPEQNTQLLAKLKGTPAPVAPVAPAVPPVIQPPAEQTPPVAPVKPAVEEQPATGYDVNSVEATMDQLQKQGGMTDETAKYWQDRDPVAFKNWAEKSGFKFENDEYQKTLGEVEKGILDVIKDYGSYADEEQIKTEATEDTSATFEKMWNDIYEKYDLGKYEQTASVNLEKYFSDSYAKYATQYDLNGLKTKIDSAQKEYDIEVEKLDKKIANANSNPWSSESIRIGDVKRANDNAEAKLKRLQNAIIISQNNYDNSNSDAKEFATKDLSTMQTERTFAVNQLNFYTDKVKDDLSLIVADKQAEAENEAAKKKAKQTQKEVDFSKLEFIIENTVIPEAEETEVYTELFRYFPEMAKEIEALRGKTSTVDSYVKAIESGNVTIGSVPADLRNQVTAKVNWTKVPKKSTTTKEPAPTNVEIKDYIDGKLKENNAYGSDPEAVEKYGRGLISWESYLWMAQTWSANGGSEKDFYLNYPIISYLDNNNQREFNKAINK